MDLKKTISLLIVIKKQFLIQCIKLFLIESPKGVGSTELLFQGSSMGVKPFGILWMLCNKELLQFEESFDLRHPFRGQGK